MTVRSDAELVARAVFALRQLTDGPGSVADVQLRAVLARWAVRPDIGLDLDSLAAAAVALRERAEPEFACWADVLEAITVADRWAVTVARYRLGDSSQQLARELAVSDSTLLARLDRSGVHVRPPGGTRHDAATKSAAAAMYVSGASARQVAARYGVSKNAVLGWLRAAGVEVRSPRTRRRR